MYQLRWSPFRDLEYVLDRHRAIQAAGTAQVTARADWQPAVDIIESEVEYLVRAELPGVSKDDVKVSVDQGVLTISGERRPEKEAEGVRHRRIERVFGSFSRRFTLPDHVDESAIRAEYRDGVLNLFIPRVAKTQPRAIDIQVH